MTSAEIDKFLMFYGRAVLGSKDASEWAKGFTKSIYGHAKRKGAEWRPSEKQAYWMRKIMEQYAPDDSEMELIEEVLD